jgi:UDP-N-acetylmuramoyl-tripeptide--D-alanyl-D-alanine ligase
MLELGPESAAFHRGLTDAIEAAGIDVVFACGGDMRHLFTALPAARQGAWTANSAELEIALLQTVGAGDAVMIKGSLGSRMGPLVKALKDRFPGGAPAA